MSGEPVLRRQLTRPKLLGFLAKQPVCRVVMEVCGSAHHWGRMIQEIGLLDTRLRLPFMMTISKQEQFSELPRWCRRTFNRQMERLNDLQSPLLYYSSTTVPFWNAYHDLEIDSPLLW